VIARLTVTLILLFGCVGAWAGKPADRSASLQPAQKLLAQGRYDLAYAAFARHARGNALAQFTLGLFHQNGWGRAADPAAACRWFEKAAARNVPAAQHFTGDCLLRGTQRPPDPQGAVAWYLKAADNGHLVSLCSAAELLIRGEGMARDVERGIALCTRAAQAEVPHAMATLARYYQEGTQVPQDLRAARYWYQQAAERRVHEAQYRLGLMLAQGEGGEPDLNAALFWLETAASEGHAPAYLPTALLYANTPRDAETQALKPEHLAKTYLWAAAAKARDADPAQRARAEALLAETLIAMPATWPASLDQKVAAHLAGHFR
jgi:TPR repeat protein